MLFPKSAGGFDDLVVYIVRLAKLYNCNLAEGLDHLVASMTENTSQKSYELFYLDLLGSVKLSEQPTKHQVAYLVHLAKVEALDALGENRKAVELLGRHV